MIGWDAHAHWFSPKVSEREARAALEEAFAHGLAGVFFGGIDPSDWEPQRELARQFPGRVIPCFGLHPEWVAAQGEDSSEVADAFARLEAFCRELPPSERYGIGELGTDRAPGESSLERQLFWARAQLRLALSLGRPAVLHGVGGLQALLDLCREEVGRQAAPVVRWRGLLHRYSGSLELAREFLKLGFLISVSPAVARPHATRLHRLVRGLAPGELLFESDGPDGGGSLEIRASAQAVATLHAERSLSTGEGAFGTSDPAFWLEKASESLLGLWPKEPALR